MRGTGTLCKLKGMEQVPAITDQSRFSVCAKCGAATEAFKVRNEWKGVACTRCTWGITCTFSRFFFETLHAKVA